MSVTRTKHSQAAFDNLVLGARENRLGNAKKADEHFTQADKHMDDHVKYLQSIGGHQEANDTLKQYQVQKKHMMAATSPIKDIPKKEEQPKVKVKKSEGIRELGKGIFAKAEKVVPAKSPSANPRYQYKGLHELHPEDQKRIVGALGGPSMYAGQDHHKFVYPTDQSGRLVHSQRIAAPEHHDFASAGQAMEQAKSKGVSFSEGQGVRMNQEGHELHGKLGIVRMHNPAFPGKVHVEFQGGRREFLDPGHIKTSGLAAKTLGKAQAIIIDIRSRLNKKKSDN